MLVPTGADVSVLPVSAVKQKTRKTLSTLQAANETRIAYYGQLSSTLNIGRRRMFQWLFIVADVNYTMVGANFRGNFNLMVDMQHNRLIDATTNLVAQLSCTAKQTFKFSNCPSLDTQCDKLLREFT